MKMKHLFELAVFSVCCKLSVAQLKLSIIPSVKNIFVKENEDLNLTCKVSYSGPKSDSFEISWNLPVKQGNVANRVSSFKRHNELTITVRKLQEEDKGRYVCEVKDSDTNWREKIDVFVNTGNEKCSRPFFDCGDALCIPHYYVCDGFEDCHGGVDESFQHCGVDACEEKFQCDGRCIPKHCCERTMDMNCSVNYFMPCCQRHVNAIIPVDILKMDGSDASAQYKYHNIGFYQSTVYTMISCAVAFIFMSTIMLIAVCRIRMRNSWYPRSSTSIQRNRFWQLFPFDNRRTNSSDLGSRTAAAASSGHSLPEHWCQNNVIDPLENYVLLAFNNSTEYQLAEYGPKPPPYTETNIGIPPPPYSSMIDVTGNDTSDSPGTVSCETGEVPPPIDAEQTEQVPQQ